MNYLVFSTRQEAEQAESAIVGNFREAVRQYNPAAVDSEGLVGRNAESGRLDYSAVRTKHWSDIIECEEGWAIVLPDDQAIHPKSMRIFPSRGFNVLKGVPSKRSVFNRITVPEVSI